MDEPVLGILGRDAELARVKYFLGSMSGRPSALMLEGTAGIGKTTLCLGQAVTGLSAFQ
jgi:Cdc6-like AAA superfamily ATPase